MPRSRRWGAALAPGMAAAIYHPLTLYLLRFCGLAAATALVTLALRLIGGRVEVSLALLFYTPLVLVACLWWDLAEAVLVIGCSACLVDYQLAASDGRLWPISRPPDRLALLTFILVGIATALPAQVGRRWQQRAALADAAIEANRLRLELIAALAQEITTPVRALDEYTQELLAGDVEAPGYRREASLQMVAARHPGGPGLIATAPHPL